MEYASIATQISYYFNVLRCQLFAVFIYYHQSRTGSEGRFWWSLDMRMFISPLFIGHVALSYLLYIILFASILLVLHFTLWLFSTYSKVQYNDLVWCYRCCSCWFCCYYCIRCELDSHSALA